MTTNNLATGNQILTLSGLRFSASLGILAHERTQPQPIQVDAELNQGRQPLLPHDECTATHINLLETLIGKVTTRLMQLPGVIGARVKIAKLEIFDDCEVSIRMQGGEW